MSTEKVESVGIIYPKPSAYIVNTVKNTQLKNLYVETKDLCIQIVGDVCTDVNKLTLPMITNVSPQFLIIICNYPPDKELEKFINDNNIINSTSIQIITFFHTTNPKLCFTIQDLWNYSMIATEYSTADMFSCTYGLNDRYRGTAVSVMNDTIYRVTERVKMLNYISLFNEFKLESELKSLTIQDLSRKIEERKCNKEKQIIKLAKLVYGEIDDPDKLVTYAGIRNEGDIDKWLNLNNKHRIFYMNPVDVDMSVKERERCVYFQLIWMQWRLFVSSNRSDFRKEVLAIINHK
jgi:hypothetical protein